MILIVHPLKFKIYRKKFLNYCDVILKNRGCNSNLL